MQRWIWMLVAGSSLGLAQCTGVLQGEPVDLADVATPPVVQQPAPPASEPRALPQLAPGVFRAWIPPEVLANGDTTEGHYLEVSPQAPAEEAPPPSVHIPRAPKHVLPTAKGTSKVRTLAPPETLTAPTMPPSVPSTGSQQGMPAGVSVPGWPPGLGGGP